MLPDIQPGNTKILYFFNCLLDGMYTIIFPVGVSFACGKSELSIHIMESYRTLLR